MATRTSTFSLIIANILIPISILIFASGFFPYKPFLSGLAEYETLSHGDPPKAPFDRVIFMVVDALRSDFVYTENSGFKFVQSLISTGQALPFTAHATSPTITMPRIKAITTGSIPSFLDVILNFAESDTTSSLSTQDTWLAQMKAKKTGKMVMYGDDTWLKLFPDTFDRFEGTSSFFVSDFTEVDHNVTRHIPGELGRKDWSTMVLHFLGLDHIGHKAGPRSPNMIPKQHEMDGIVNEIYQAMSSNEVLKHTLLVLCGDHGMNDAGNHGGSAPGETSPALVFISPRLDAITQGATAPAEFQEDFQYYTTVEQSDIAPTLGALLGFPVPRNNLGAFIPQFLPFWTSNNDKVQILLRNAKQFLAVVTATFPSFGAAGPSENYQDLSSEVDELACSWRRIIKTLPDPNNEEEDIKPWLSSTTKWLQQAQAIMSSTASNYDVPKLILGQSIAAISFLFSIIAAYPTLSQSWKSSPPFILICLLYGIMMFASSYVEEEQHFWYWATSGWLAILWVKSTRKPLLPPTLLILTLLLTLLLHRLTRRYNQTGQKYTSSPSISTFLSSPPHLSLLWSLITLTYLYNLQLIASNGFKRFKPMVAGIIATIITTASATFKIAFTHEDSPELMVGLVKRMGEQEVGVSLVGRARMVFGLTGLAALYSVITGFGYGRRNNPTLPTLHSLLLLLLITQSRTLNIPLLLLLSLLYHLLSTLSLSPLELSTTTLLLQYTSFFAFGGSNAISSIDLSSAYNGVGSYNVVMVGVLLFLSNWTGPIFWLSSTNLLLLKMKSKSSARIAPSTSPSIPSSTKPSTNSNTKSEGLWTSHISLLTLFATSSLTAVMIACTVLRTHLFIWTVFSPKFLYAMAWGVGMHLGFNVVVGGGLWALGGLFIG